MTTQPPVFEVLPRDLSAYRQGNTGIPYVHRFESGKPVPHVLINALTHGNELCGMTAATHLLDTGVRPKPMAIAGPSGQYAISPAVTTSRASVSRAPRTGMLK